MKPKRCTASGLNMKFTMVAMKPMNVAVPSFLTHHTANIRAAKPIRSQRKGKLNSLKKTVISSTLHVHREENKCLEIIAVKGSATEVGGLTRALMAKKGVKQVKVAIVAQ